jgi:hypothetical protein
MHQYVYSSRCSFRALKPTRRSPKTRQKVEDRLVEQKKTDYVQIFSGMKHGSAVRYDSNAENERE